MLSQYERTIQRFRRQLFNEEAATRRELARAYRDASREISRRIAVLLADDRDPRRVARLQELERQIEQELIRLVDTSTVLLENGQRTMARLGPEQAAGQVAARVPGLELSFSRLPTEAFETMVGSLADGTPLRASLSRYGIVASQEAGRILATAIAIGTGPRATARQLREVLGVFQWEAERIARTEQIRVFRESSRQTYIRNRDIVSGYRRLTAKDASACPVCLALDGTFYELDQMMPSHPNCRCTMLPVLRDRFGDAPVLETGAEWFDRQDAATQRIVLGPGKFALFEAGDLELIALVHEFDDPVLGPQVQEVPLSVLRSRRRRAA